MMRNFSIPKRIPQQKLRIKQTSKQFSKSFIQLLVWILKPPGEIGFKPQQLHNFFFWKSDNSAVFLCLKQFSHLLKKALIVLLQYPQLNHMSITKKINHAQNLKPATSQSAPFDIRRKNRLENHSTVISQRSISD